MDLEAGMVDRHFESCNIAKHSHFSPLKATVCMQVKASDWQDGGEGKLGQAIEEVAEEMK